MKIYDISQELFGCVVFPGDPAPKREILNRMDEGSLYNLTAFSMCAHNGTHVDAPFHFINDGKTVEKLPLESTVGYAFVADCNGILNAEDAEKVLQKARALHPQAGKRILLKGKTTVSREAAETFAAAELLLLGNESQTVGPEEAPAEIHRILLGKGTVLLEGVRLSHVPEGVYLLSAAPLALGGSDGAPCRAILMDTDVINE